MPPESVNGPTRNVFDKMMVQYPAMSGKRSDLVLHYTFEKLDEDMVLDSSGFNNNARLIEGKGECNFKLLTILDIILMQNNNNAKD